MSVGCSEYYFLIAVFSDHGVVWLMVLCLHVLVSVAFDPRVGCELRMVWCRQLWFGGVGRLWVVFLGCGSVWVVPCVKSIGCVRGSVCE